ncbi:hypothetical protein D9M68_428360 [compost metagenome]
MRAYAISGFAGLPPVQRVEHLLPLLDDPQRAVRDEALRALAGIALPKARRADFKTAQDDYEQRLRGNADLPGNRLNLAVLLDRSGRQLEALEQYRQALRMDPYFSPARVNLVTLANGMLRQDEAEQVLREGVALDKMPPAARGNLAYMLALLLVERGQAAGWLGETAEAMPDNPLQPGLAAAPVAAAGRRPDRAGGGSGACAEECRPALCTDLPAWYCGPARGRGRLEAHDQAGEERQGDQEQAEVAHPFWLPRDPEGGRIAHRQGQ